MANRFSGVQNWMFRNADQYETATELAEAAAAQFDLYENNRRLRDPRASIRDRGPACQASTAEKGRDEDVRS